MVQSSSSFVKDVFISYASRDGNRVVPIADALESVSISVWRDQNQILGGDCYGPVIVRAIRNCQALVLMCSDASLRSKNVKQEIQLAWKYDVPYVPLLLEPAEALVHLRRHVGEGCGLGDRHRRRRLGGRLKRGSSDQQRDDPVTHVPPSRLKQGYGI